MKGFKFISLTILIFIMLFYAGCNKEHTTKVSGTVINWGTKLPIDSATVTLKDGVGSSGFSTGFQTSTANRNSTTTNEQGEFSLEITGEYEAFLSVGKKGYEYNPNWNGTIAQGVRGFGFHGGNFTNVICEMKAQAFFNGVFKKITMPSKTDSLFIKLISEYGGQVSLTTGHNPYEPYIGEGPFSFASPDTDGTWITGDRYLNFELRFKRNNVWIFKKDSIYVKSFEVYRDTIFY